MKIQKLILGSTKNLGRKIYIWTILSGIAYALTTFLLTWVVTATLGKEAADPFNFAYTTGQLFLTVGFYGMRVFQASDIKNTYSFNDYCISRIVSCGVMVAASVVFVLINGYTFEKAVLILLVCAYRGFDAVSDVFEALYQQQGRMDVSGKSSFFKIAISTAAFILVFLLTKSTIMATLTALLSTIAVWIFLDLSVVSKFASMRLNFKTNAVKSLLIACFPLCMGNFLCNYVFSASKFAIDQQGLAGGFQTIYNILFMPASVINLFSGFVFKPMVTSLAARWEDREYQSFNKTLLRLCGLVFGLTVAAIVGGYFLGIPILAFVYNTDLSDYRLHLVLMILGGGLSALSTILYYVATIMRCQKHIMGIYGITALAALVFSGVCVRRWGLMGASVAYLGLMLLMTILFIALCIQQNRIAYAKLEKEVNVFYDRTNL